jgi:hypothetical protein
MKKSNYLTLLIAGFIISFTLHSCKDDDVKNPDPSKKDKPTTSKECRLTNLTGFDGTFEFDYDGDKILKITDEERVYHVKYDGERFSKVEMESNSIKNEWNFVYDGNKVVRVNVLENSEDSKYMEYIWTGDDITNYKEYVKNNDKFELNLQGNMTYANNNLLSFEVGDIVDEELQSDFSLANIKVDDKTNPLYKYRELFLALDVGAFFNFSVNNIIEANIETELLPFPLTLKFDSKYNDQNLPTELKGQTGSFDINVLFGYDCK